MTTIYRFDGWTFDAGRRSLKNPDGEPVSLTPRETALLQAFLDKPRTDLSREVLADAVYGDHPPNEHLRTLTVHVCRLRTKLNDREQESPMILMVRYGYWFCPEPEIVSVDAI